MTERLRLEPWDEMWLDQFAALAADPDVIRWIGAGQPWPREKSEEEFQWMLEHWRRYGFGWRSVIDKDSGAWLGFLGLNHVTPKAVELNPDDIEIGWWLQPEVWGRGFATEGAIAIRDEAFDGLGLNRIVSRHHAANPASGRVMEKIGMTFVRDATGRHQEPVRIYTLERDEWATVERQTS